LCTGVFNRHDLFPPNIKSALKPKAKPFAKVH
jgi:hypothetical protein